MGGTSATLSLRDFSAVGRSFTKESIKKVLGDAEHSLHGEYEADESCNDCADEGDRSEWVFEQRQEWFNRVEKDPQRKAD